MIFLVAYQYVFVVFSPHEHDSFFLHEVSVVDDGEALWGQLFVCLVVEQGGEVSGLHSLELDHDELVATGAGQREQKLEKTNSIFALISSAGQLQKLWPVLKYRERKIWPQALSVCKNNIALFKAS